MSMNSGAFDLLADVLHEARPPVAKQKPSKRKRSSRADREIDRSRDHAVYAAPHRPIRPHAYSRPDDVATERVHRPSLVSISDVPLLSKPPPAKRGFVLPIVAFVLTFALAVVGFLVTR